MTDPVTADLTFETVGYAYVESGYVGRPLGEGAKIRYMVSDGRIEIQLPLPIYYDLGPSTGPADRPFAADGTYVVERYDGRTFEFSFGTPSVQGVPMSYLRWGSIFDPGMGILEAFFFGFTTDPADIPRDGSASYRAEASGSFLDPSSGRYNLNGAAQFSANFAEGTIETSIQGRGVHRSDPALTLDLGIWTGVGTIDSGGPAFHGMMSDTMGDLGEFYGAFYGPNAAEMGYRFILGRGNFEAVGSVLGRREP